jgi:hypothetical protein
MTLIVAAAINPMRTRFSVVDRQFREVPASALRTFGDEVVDYPQLNDPDLAQRFLGEAVTALSRPPWCEWRAGSRGRRRPMARGADGTDARALGCGEVSFEGVDERAGEALTRYRRS